MQQSEAEVDNEEPNTSGCSSGCPRVLFKVRNNRCLNKTIQCEKKMEMWILSDCLELEVYSKTWKVNWVEQYRQLHGCEQTFLFYMFHM